MKGLLGCAVLAMLVAAGCGGSSSPHAHRTVVLTARAAGWRLPAPVSAEAVVPHGRYLYVAGGLTASGISANGIFRVDPRTGRTIPAGTLPRATHDAGAAVLGGRALVIGGGAATTDAGIQSFVPGRSALVTGRLPRPRSDLVAATSGARTYVVGGYDGKALSPEVLATGDGRQFTTVARLPQPVRYPAAAVLSGSLYVFGGEGAAGQSRAIQEVNLATRRTRVAGQLPVGLSHAGATVLGGRIYVLGGRTGASATDRIWAFDPSRGTMSAAGLLPRPVSDAGMATIGNVTYVVGGRSAKALRDVAVLHLTSKLVGAPASAKKQKIAAAPFQGRLLIADRGNDRLLLVDPAKHILWRYPSPTAKPPRGGFYFPDDAFFIRSGAGIISNEEDNDTIVEIGFPSGKILWSYGHPRHAGSSRGYLNQPDDAYLLKDGTVTVADAKNCRIAFIGPEHRVRSQIGTAGSCLHHPPGSLAYPNGDTPLQNGNFLISEVQGSYVDEITRGGRLVWNVHLPIAYPSDPQQLGRDLYLVADYTRPGGLYEFTRSGRIVWSYHPQHGARMLDHPSLAERLPNGLIAVNDDYRHRVVIIDPKTRRIVWQYGHTDHAGRGPGHLRIPDGFDLLIGHITPTHPFTG